MTCNCFVPQIHFCFTKPKQGITLPAHLFAKGRRETQKKSKGHGVFTATRPANTGKHNLLTINML